MQNYILDVAKSVFDQIVDSAIVAYDLIFSLDRILSFVVGNSLGKLAMTGE